MIFIWNKISTDGKEFEESEKGVQDLLLKLISNKGKNSVDYYHKKLGKIMWNKCGMSRNQNDLVDAINIKPYEKIKNYDK